MHAPVTIDATYQAFAVEVEEAERALEDEIRKKPKTWREPYELRREVRNGWSAGAMGVALDSLIDKKVLEVDSSRRVRLQQST